MTDHHGFEPPIAPGRARLALIGVALVAVLAGGVLVLRDDAAVVSLGEGAAQEVLALPGEDEQVVAAELSDGTWVWVLRTGGEGDAAVRVVEAEDPHGWMGLRSLVAWCPSSGWFEAPGTASRWDEHGRWRGGPSGRDLATWETRVPTDEAGAPTGEVLLGARRQPGDRSPDGVGGEPVGPSCLDDGGPLSDDLGLDGRYPVALSSVPDRSVAEVVQADARERVVVAGTLLLRGDEPILLCERVVPPPLRRPEAVVCEGAVVELEPWSAAEGWQTDGWWSAEGRVLGRTGEATLADAIWLPGATYDHDGAYAVTEERMVLLGVDEGFAGERATLWLRDVREDEDWFGTYEVTEDLVIVGSSLTGGEELGVEELRTLRVPDDGVVVDVELVGGRVSRAVEVTDATLTRR